MMNLESHLHPMLAVFPAALLPLALITEILARVPAWQSGEVGKGMRVFGRFAVSFAALMVIGAFISGYYASDHADQLFQVPDEPISTHHAMGRLLLFLVIPLAFLHWLAVFAVYGKKTFEVCAFFLLVTCAVLVGATGYLGGELVFRFGAGVKVQPSQSVCQEISQKVCSEPARASSASAMSSAWSAKSAD